MNLAIIAPPNGGKGTTWYEVLKKYPQLQPYVCSDHIGELIKSNHPDGDDMRKYIDAGKLVPDEIVNKIVFDRLRSMNGPRWQDGFPRTIPQADAYEQEMGLEDLAIIYFWIPDEVCIARAESRRVCTCCGKTQRVTEDGSCEFGCTDQKGIQAVRKDDARILKRLADYRQDTEPVVEHLMKKGVPVFTVNAALGTKHIVPQILKFLHGLLCEHRENHGIH